MKPVYLLTGQPGTGKTSLIKQVVAGFPTKAGGFYTEEIRRQGTRLGFKLVTLKGQEAILAHIDFNKRFRVGKYGVDVSVMDKVGVPALREAAEQCDLVIVDEIGKMELFSSAFREAVPEIIGSDYAPSESVRGCHQAPAPGESDNRNQGQLQPDSRGTEKLAEIDK
jgi:nucleoside-triphosphatase